MTTAVIAFRVGSKGVEHKNTRDVAGKTLWLWSYRAAMDAETVGDILVTTDNESSLEVAHDLGCLITARPPRLADDVTPLDDAILHALHHQAVVGTVVVLQPTVPVRRPGLVDDCVRMFERFPEANSLLTANFLHFVWDGNSGRQLNPPRVNRQHMDNTLFHEDGSVYVIDADVYREHRDRVVAPVTLYETDRTVDIDTEADMELADFLLRRREKARKRTEL